MRKAAVELANFLRVIGMTESRLSSVYLELCARAGTGSKRPGKYVLLSGPLDHKKRDIIELGHVPCELLDTR